MKIQRPIFIVMEWLVKVPAFRSLFYHVQNVLYSRPLLSGVIFLILYMIVSLYPVRTGNFTISVSTYELNRDNLTHAIVTPVYIRLLLVTIFLSVPPFLTLILDLWKLFADKMSQLEFCSYLLLMLSFIIPNLFAYVMFHDLDPATITDNMLYLWLAVGKIQQVAITLGMLAAIFGHRAKYATNDSLSFLRFSIEKRTVNIMLSMFLSALFAMLNGKALGITRLRLLSMAFFLIGVFLCLATAVRISLMLFRQAFAEKQFRTHHHVSDFMYTFGFASFIIIGIFFSVAAARAGGSEAALLRYLISFVATQVFLICIVSVIPGVKFQRLAALRHEQLETRLNLIRYVSHEMRTPLNTVTMGMKILKEEMMAVSGIKTTSFDYTQSQASLRPSKPSFQGAGAESKMENLHQSSNTLSNSSARINSHGQGQSLSEKIVLLSEAVINRSQFVQAFHDMLETVQQVSESCNVAVSTLDDLLTFDKIDENKLVIEVEELNPWRLLLETAKPFTINASLKNIKFRINLLEQNHHFLKTFCVRGDAFKLAQVIRNLLSNAIKFTPENGNVDVTLRLNESVERGRCVRFSVKDSGAGISKQNMKKLFGQYVQFNAAQLQKGKGSGLGLWITKSIVEMHGGLIAANSDGEGHGTEFYFDIPLHKQAKYSKSGKLRASMIALESEGLEDIMEEGAEALRQFEAEQDEEQQSPTVKNKHVEIPTEKNSTPSVVSKPPSIPIPDKLDTSANVSWWTLLQRIFTFGRSSKIHTNGTEIENPSPSSSTHRSRETTVHSMTKNFLNYPVKLLTRRLTRPDVHSPDDISGGNDNENDNENESLSTVTFLKVPKEEEADIENQNGLGRTYNSQNHLIEGNMVYCPENHRLEDYEIVEENPERTSSEISTDLPKNNSSGSKNVTINLKVERIPTEDEIEHPSTAPHTPPTSNMMNKTPSKIVQPKLEPGIASPKLPTEEKEEAKPAVVINEFNLLLNSSPVTSPSPQRKRAISESPQPTYRRINNNNNNNDGLSSPPNGVSDEFKRFRSQTCVEAKENRSDSPHLQNGHSKRTWDSGLNILLVDDADSNRKMCRRFLTTQRHNVLEAKDGLDCLRVYDESLKNNLVFDLILMDDNMPNLLGYEAAKRLRDRGYTGVIVGVTGDIYPENIERFTKNGANEVLGKPLNVTKLRERFCQLAP